MRQIHNFRIDLNSDSLENVKEIKSYIDKFSNNDEIKNICLKISRILEIPEEVIVQKFKQVIYTKFDYFSIQPKFKLKLNPLEFIKYTILFIPWILLNTKYFSKNKLLRRKKVKVILDNVEKEYVINKFKKLLSKFENSLILLNKTFSFKKDKNFIFLKPKIYVKSKIIIGKNFYLFKLLINLIKLSLKNNINLIEIFFLIIHSSLKYYNIFNNYDSKILVHDRIYHTCPIRNFLFLKMVE